MFSSMKTLFAITALLLAAPIHGLENVSNTLPTTAPDVTTTPDETTTTAATTTPAPTTTPPTTTTTTPKPSTTTAAPTPAPTTPAPSTIGNWNVTDKNNITCLMIQATIQISVAQTVDNKTVFANLTVPAVGSTASGTCDNETQSISISWKPADLDPTLVDQIDITFSLNTTTKTYNVSKIAVSVYPNATDKKLVKLESTSVVIPPIPLAMSYRCSPAEKFNLTDDISFLEVSDLQVQAFHVSADAKFGAASECQAGDTADIVPIVVGCALAGLVVIVLIAYLVGRRRSRQSGYLSM